MIAGKDASASIRQFCRKGAQFLTLFSIISYHGAASRDENSSISKDQHSSSCGLFLAESSIKNSGFGVFAGRDFSNGERIVS